jgi:hypothetical protein
MIAPTPVRLSDFFGNLSVSASPFGWSAWFVFFASLIYRDQRLFFYWMYSCKARKLGALGGIKPALLAELDFESNARPVPDAPPLTIRFSATLLPRLHTNGIISLFFSQTPSDHFASSFRALGRTS